MNAMTQSGGTSLASTANAFAAYGEAVERMTGSAIIGDILKFSKGEWMYGQSGHDVERGTEVIMDIFTLTLGYQRWEDKRPADARMGLLHEGFTPPDRSELGYMDKGTWELDSNGKPQDPWQFTNMVVCRDKANSSQLYTYATSSKSAIKSLGRLITAIGKEVGANPAKLPVIALSRDYWTHDEYGRIYFPEFQLKGWTDEWDGATEQKAAADAQQGSSSVEDDDEIPF